MHSDQKPNSSHHCLPWLALFPCDAAAAQPRVRSARGNKGSLAVLPTAAECHPRTAVLPSPPPHPMAWQLLFPPPFPIKHVPDLGGVKSWIACGNTFTGTGLLFLFLPINSSRPLWPRHLRNCESAQKGEKSEPRISLKWWSLTDVAEDLFPLQQTWGSQKIMKAFPSIEKSFQKGEMKKGKIFLYNNKKKK